MTIEEFKTLKSEGKTNQQIADLWGVSISTIKRFIRANKLYTRNTEIDEKEFLRLYEQGLEDEEIAKELNLTKTFIYNYRRKLNLDSQHDKKRKLNQQKFLQLLEEGKNDSEIGRILGVSNTVIHYWRESLTDKESNFEYKRKFDTEKFLDLYYSGLNYVQIAKELGCSSSAIQEYGQSLGLTSNTYNKDIPTLRQQQIIIGSLLGDMGLVMPKKGKHARGCFAHSLKQENYGKWMEQELSNFCAKGVYKEQYDQRTNKVYKAYYVDMKASEYLTTLYYKFYPKGKKIIPKELLYTLDGLGIAVWFMNDGYKNSGSFSIATNCFTVEDLEMIKEFFKIKFNINISIHKDHTIYIKADSRETFIDLIKDYIHPDCLYKLAI
jgi:DNA-binding CsgD family transcriptional regulator